MGGSLLAALAVWLASATAAAAQWGQPPAGPAGSWAPAAAPAGFDSPAAQWIAVPGRHGRAFPAAVLRPPGPGPFPVVVLLHGGGGFEPHHVALAAEVARAGLLVVAGCWQAAAGDAVCAGATPQADWAADPAAHAGTELLAAARALPGARADRVGLYGLSRGGYAALWAASTGAGVQAVVADAPAHRPPVSPAPASTLEVVAGLAAPLLLLHGTADPVIPVAQSREYERAARALGKPVTAVYLEGAGHQTTLWPESQAEARQRATAFLRAHLLATGAAPAPRPRAAPRTGAPPGLAAVGATMAMALLAVGQALRRFRRAPPARPPPAA